MFVGAICGADTKQTNTTSVFVVIIKRKSRDFIETLFLTPGLLVGKPHVYIHMNQLALACLEKYSESR